MSACVSGSALYRSGVFPNTSHAKRNTRTEKYVRKHIVLPVNEIYKSASASGSTQHAGPRPKGEQQVVGQTLSSIMQPGLKLPQQ